MDSPLPSSNQKPFGEIHSLLDCAEQHIIEMVRARVRQQVEERLLNEFSELIQAETEKALAGICFDLHMEKDMLTHSDRLQILLTWAKAKEGKKILRSKTIVTEEIV
jgi:L-lactate utilization protein LutB